MAKIAFVGLGNMGAPMAANLVKPGHSVAAFDLSEAAKEAGIKFIVLDRVNPIGGVVVDGPIRKGEGNDFVAFHEIPVQHGMTAGDGEPQTV